MQNKVISVIFLSKSSMWPKDLVGEDWELAKEQWFDWKGIAGPYLPGLALVVGSVAIGGVSAHLRKDPKSKQKVLASLREQGFEPEILVDQSPY